MQRQRRTDTRPELALRRRVFAMGLRYRVDALVLPGSRRRADIVFAPAQVAVYLDGCFWHSCPVHGTQPKANAEWWATKLSRNTQRDRETDRLLADAGWVTVHVWEHEDPEEAASRVRDVVSGRRAQGSRRAPGKSRRAPSR